MAARRIPVSRIPKPLSGKNNDATTSEPRTPQGAKLMDLLMHSSFANQVNDTEEGAWLIGAGHDAAKGDVDALLDDLHGFEDAVDMGSMPSCEPLSELDEDDDAARAQASPGDERGDLRSWCCDGQLDPMEAGQRGALPPQLMQAVWDALRWTAATAARLLRRQPAALATPCTVGAAASGGSGRSSARSLSAAFDLAAECRVPGRSSPLLLLSAAPAGFGWSPPGRLPTRPSPGGSVKLSQRNRR